MLRKLNDLLLLNDVYSNCFISKSVTQFMNSFFEPNTFCEKTNYHHLISKTKIDRVGFEPVSTQIKVDFFHGLLHMDILLPCMYKIY